MNSLLAIESTKYGIVINAINDLQINNICKIVLGDVNKANKICNILENILIDKETIEYRQDIITDFINNRSIYLGLLKECLSLDKVLSDYDSCKSHRVKMKLKSDISISDLQVSLRDYAYTFKKLIEIYNRLDNIFSEVNIFSIGLNGLKKNIHKITKNETVLDLIILLDKIISSGNAFSYTISLDDYLMPKDEKYILCNGKYEGEKFSLFKKKNTNNKVELNDIILTDSKRIINTSYNRVCVIIESMFEDIYNKVGYISKDMCFYEFAIKLYDMLNSCNKDLSFPKVSTIETIYKEAIDPYLLLRYLVEDIGGNIYGNDIDIKSDKNALVFGQNNSGKTVFLRTLGIYQIFSQNGLFLPCKIGSFVIKNQIVSIFSGEEKDTNVGGRFEKEAIDIKNIIDKVDENSLVIINEIFQSTFALDGMNALLDILTFFDLIKVKWITVTHLINEDNDLKELNVKLYKTTGKDNNYKIKEINNG